MTPPQTSGKLLTLGLIAIAIAAAAFAWWFQFSRGRRALAYWGGADAAVIRHGERAALLVIGPEGKGAKLDIGGAEYEITRVVPLDNAPGFVHARHALIDDASYQWDAAPPQSVTWTHALQFEDARGRTVTVAISLTDGVLLPLTSNHPLTMSETLQSGLKDFFEEQDRQQESQI